MKRNISELSTFRVKRLYKKKVKYALRCEREGYFGLAAYAWQVADDFAIEIANRRANSYTAYEG